LRARVAPRLVLGALAGWFCAGCIERTLSITSEPAGAAVRLNGTPVGTTPVCVRFRHYGDYSVELRREGCETLEAVEEIHAPAYARFPLCLLTELLWPGVIHDARYLSYSLPPPRVPDREELVRRARAAAAPGE
jgi:hypothetical protein